MRVIDLFNGNRVNEVIDSSNGNRVSEVTDLPLLPVSIRAIWHRTCIELKSGMGFSKTAVNLMI